MPPTFLPRPRRQIERVGDRSIADALFDRRTELSPLAVDAFSRCDGTRTIDDVRREVAAAFPRTDPAAADRALRGLFLALTFEGTGEAIVEAAANVKAGAPLLPVILPQARFACRANGDCCSSYNYGPLTDEDLARLGALDIVKAFPQLGAGPYVKEMTEQGVALKDTDDGSCVFLLPDRRCGIHAAFGVEAKPSLCRAYPWRAQATLEGLKIYDNNECGNFGWTSQEGPLLADELSQVVPLLPRKLDLRHPVIRLGADLVCDHGYVLALQRLLCELVAGNRGSAGETVLALARVCREFGDRLASCPLEPGAPEAALAQIGDAVRTGDFDRAPEISPVDAAAAAHEASSRYLECVRERNALRANTARVPFDSLSQPLMDVLCVLGTWADRAAGSGAVLAVRLDAPDVQAAFRRSLSNQVFADAFLVGDNLPVGLKKLAMAFLLTAAGAKLAAHRRGAARATLDDFSWGHKLAIRGQRWPILVRTLRRRPADVWALAAACAGFEASHLDPRAQPVAGDGDAGQASRRVRLPLA